MQSKIEKLLQLKEIQTLSSILGREADLHLVGGAVRDLILEKEPKDLDIATKLTPEQVTEKLEAAKIRVIPIGIRRGTVCAMIGFSPIEITTFRNPQKETLFTNTIEEDLPARDFTINAMAISINSGGLIDPFGGEKDLRNNVLRAVGNPSLRFTEDPHRILRLIRFGVGHGRTVGFETQEAARNLKHLLAEEKVERIAMEFSKIMMLPTTTAACLREMQDLGILEIVLPEIIPCIGLKQNSHHKFDVFEHTLAVISNIEDGENLRLRLAALFHDIGKAETSTVINGVIRMLGHEEVSERITREAMTRLRYSSFTIDSVCTLVKLHMKPIHMGAAGIRRLIRETGFLLDDWLDLKKADTLGGRNLDYDFDVEWKKFFDKVEHELYRKDVPAPQDPMEIDGNQIMALGVPHGPKVGKILTALRELVIEDPTLNTRSILLEKAKELLKEEEIL